MIVGLTGGIASGKSTVAQYLRTLGATVIDADMVAREIVAPGSETLDALVQAFGTTILMANGELDREVLGALVVNDADARARLDSITHPRIRSKISSLAHMALTEGAVAVFVEAALLIETGSAKLYPVLWVVQCSQRRQVERLMARKGCDRVTAEAWIATQMSAEEKAAHATVVLDNDDDLDALHGRVQAAYDALMGPLLDRD